MLCALAVQAEASAQEAQIRAQEAFRELGQQPRVRFVLRGTESAGGRTTEIEKQGVLLIWERRAYIDVVTFRDGVLQERWVGDGHLLWRFNAVRNEFSSSAYDALDGGAQNPLRSMLNVINTSADSRMTFITRLFLDAQRAMASASIDPDAPVTGGSAGQWAPFYPMMQLSLVENWVVAESQRPQPTRINYYLGDRPDQPKLRRVTWLSNSTVGSDVRVTSWTLDLMRDSDAVVGGFAYTPTYQFQPPQGARPVSNASLQRGL